MSSNALSHPWPPQSSHYDAIVIGSGPNGLAAAVTLAEKKLSVLVIEANGTIGGGARTMELTLPGFRHDLCSAIHPLGVASPFYRSLPLEEYGLQWMHSPLPYAHPLDDGSAVGVRRSLEETAASLQEDEYAYRALFEPFAPSIEELLGDVLRPPLRIPKHPMLMLKLGMRALRSLDRTAGSFKTLRARALLAGIGAHSALPFSESMSGAAGLLLGLVAHTHGWPFPRGGSQAITDATAKYFLSLGGEIAHGYQVKDLESLPSAKAILFDTSPRALAHIAGDKLPRSYTERLSEFRYGPSVFKLDWALKAAIPWTAKECHEAATVHVGGTYEEIASAEASAWNGEKCEKPFLIVTQPSLFDSSRAPMGQHTAWGYCHVPHHSSDDYVEQIERQIERFAPGFKDTILARHTAKPSDIERHNANNIGGDISGGVMSFGQFIARPVWGRDPYRTPAKKLFLCSSSTPPGPGVHGMCGHLAAMSALRSLRNTVPLHL